MNRNGIAIPSERLTEFCRRHHVRKLSLFGSVLGTGFRPESDVDVLVEFEPGQAPGWDIIKIEDELSGLLDGRKVDLATEKSLNRWIRRRVMDEAEVLYVAQG